MSSSHKKLVVDIAKNNNPNIIVTFTISNNLKSVFYRNNSQSRHLEDVLRKERIPYKIVAGMEFYERKEIKDLLAYFSEFIFSIFAWIFIWVILLC